MYQSNKELEEVVKVLDLLMRTPPDKISGSTHIQVDQEWLAVERKSLADLLKRSTAAHIAYCTTYGIVSVVAFRAPATVYVCTYLKAADAWCVSVYPREQVAKFLNDIHLACPDASQECGCIRDEEALSVLGEIDDQCMPVYKGTPIDQE